MEVFELFIRFARERVCRAPHIVSNTTVFLFVDQTVYVCVSRPVCVLHWKTYDLCVCVSLLYGAFLPDADGSFNSL